MPTRRGGRRCRDAAGTVDEAATEGSGRAAMIRIATDAGGTFTDLR
jgi:hypothetical protein